MTKTELLSEIALAMENNACLMVRASDSFTDTVRILLPHTMDNFKEEVEDFAVELIDFVEDNIACVKMNSVAFDDEKNQYFIFNAKAVATEEVKALCSLVDADV